jgi:Ca-activated chloride channel family protein
MAKNTADTRIFTFGVGDDVNATLLDQLADQTRAVSTFVRPSEDIEAKCSVLYDKISHPVLANLKLKVNNVQVSEMYPPHLPDLFHGGQVVVLGKYEGHGAAEVILTGMVGKEKKEFVYEMKFDKKTGEDKAFVEQLWARRKVGYLLDQIRANGEKKELVDEVTAVAKKHGIATPYTAYLVAPDAGKVANGANATLTQPQLEALGAGNYSDWSVGLRLTPGQLKAVIGRPGVAGSPSPTDYDVPFADPQLPLPTASTPTKATATLPQGHYLQNAPQSAPPASLAAAPAPSPGDRGRVIYASHPATGAAPAPTSVAQGATVTQQFQPLGVMAEAAAALRNGDRDGYQSGRVGVELSLQLKQLREQNQLDAAAMKRVGGRSLRDIGGAWVDDGLAEKTKLVEVQAMSAAYFRILEKHPEMAEVFQLGKRVVWVTPSGVALVIDVGHGKEKLDDKDIEALFVALK